MTRVGELAAPFSAGVRQAESARAWRDPATRALLLSGAIRSGKSAAGLRLLVETALEVPSNYLVSRLSYRELEDSLKPALLRGDGETPPLLPSEAIREERRSDNVVVLHNGSRLMFRSLDDPRKLLSTTYGGALIDQAEELDEGPEGEHVFDTVMGRLSDPRGPRKAILIANPGPTTHWLWRRFVSERTREGGFAVVEFSLLDNEAFLPRDYVASMLATRESRPHFFATFVEGRWGVGASAAYVGFSPATHVVEPFVLPEHWGRFESMDHGSSAPTAWILWATDEDGNLISADEHYRAGWLVSAHAKEVLARRRPARMGGTPMPACGFWETRELIMGREGWAENRVLADPSVMASQGLSTRWGRPASVATEYAEHGVYLSPANNDRAAGHARLLELIHPDPARRFPRWHPRAGELGSPRLFVFSGCVRLIEQLQAAPTEDEGPLAGRAVSGKWEGSHGHIHASARYGCLEWAGPSVEPDEFPDDPRLAWWQRVCEAQDSPPEVRRYAI